MKHSALPSAVVLISIMLFTTVLNAQIGPVSTQRTDPVDLSLSSQTYVEHGAIHITSDADFESQAWPGNGTEGNPYRIEGLNITTDSVCVNITGTSAFFVIQDCLFASSSNDDYYGVYLVNVSNGVIKDNIVTMVDTGIYISIGKSIVTENNTIFNVQAAIASGDLSSCSFSFNEIYNCTWGVQSWSANDTLLTNNTVYDYLLYGFTVGGTGSGNSVAYNDIHSPNDELSSATAITFDSPAWVIEYNSIHDGFEGIEIWFSGLMPGKMVIRENTFQRMRNALNLFWGGSNISFVDNTVADSGNGVVLAESEDCEVIGNVFTNITFRAIELRNSINITISGNAMESSGIRIQGYTISTWRHTITGNTVGGKDLGYFLNTEDLEIDGSRYGQMILVNCTDVVVNGGTFHDVMTGISIAFSDGCVAKDVEIHHSFVTGIRLFYSDDCRIEGSRIYNNSHFYQRQGGITLHFVINCTITENHIYLNTGSGITSQYFAQLINCTIVNNAIYNNTLFGIDIQDGSGNTVYGNALGWNEEGNAFDDGSDNTWDDGVSIGNWWSDYTTAQGNTYNITGGAESLDRFPNLLQPGIPTLPLEAETTSSQPFVIDPFLLLIPGGVAVVVIVVVAKRRK
ncbi:MAG: NosD domain-containing protein [Candidatus Thorarchaeota archaeon]